MGGTNFLGVWIHEPRIFFGYEVSSADAISATYLAVLFTKKDSTFGMLQEIFRTVSFFILSSLTWFQLIPMMLWMAVIWKASRRSLLF